MSEEEGEVVNVGWVSLSRSGKSLTIRVMNQTFFVPLGDLQKVLNGERGRVDVKQWVERERPVEQSFSWAPVKRKARFRRKKPSTEREG